jgi:hypothetical protein
MTGGPGFDIHCSPVLDPAWKLIEQVNYGREMKMSVPVNSTRRAGMIVLVGAIIGIGVSLLLNAAYSLTPDGADLAIPPWQPALERAAGPALTFAPPVEVYHLYGRVVLLVIAAFMVGLHGLYANQRAVFDGKPPRLQVWGYRLAMAGLAMNLIGNLGDYWVSVGETINFVAFLVGTFVGLLLQMAGLALLAVGGLRGASMPKPVAWALILVFPLAVALLLAGMNNLPSAPLLALSLAWAITGASMAWSGLEHRALHRQTFNTQ